MTSVNSLLSALQKDDYLRDYAHADRLFVRNNYELQPRYQHLFHVVFNLTPEASEFFDNLDKHEINMLVKNIDLPSIDIDIQKHNQYNRQVHSQHKVNYSPVNITFHDDNKDLVRSFLHTYMNFYYADSRYVYDSGTYNTNRYAGFRDTDWGLSDGNVRFFRDIRVYSMMQKRFAEYVLVNPIISSLNHDQHSYDANGLMEHRVSIEYETVKYSTGFVNNVNPKGFGTLHYDTTPSPIGVFGQGPSNSAFFGGGIIDAANTVAKDLASGNVLDAIKKAGVIVAKSRNADIGDILKRDGKRVLNDVIRGKNPLDDVVLPTILGGSGSRGGDSSARTTQDVDRANPGSSDTTVSNGKAVSNTNTYSSPGISPPPTGNASHVPSVASNSPSVKTKLSDTESVQQSESNIVNQR